MFDEVRINSVYEPVSVGAILLEGTSIELIFSIVRLIETNLPKTDGTGRFSNDTHIFY